MNKHELIKKYKRLEGVWDAPGAETARQIFLQDLEQLDEPEKVKIPQFVAEHIEWTKEEDFHLLGAMNRENFEKNSKTGFIQTTTWNFSLEHGLMATKKWRKRSGIQ